MECKAWRFMLTSTFIGGILLYKTEAYPTVDQIPPELLALLGKVGLFELGLLLLGLVVFLAGVGLVGWIRSRTIGVISSVCAIVSLVVMLWALAELFPA